MKINDARDDETNWVSPYLRRPLRSLEQVLAERHGETPPRQALEPVRGEGSPSIGPAHRGAGQRPSGVTRANVVKLRHKVA